MTFVASRTRAAEFDPKFLSDHYRTCEASYDGDDDEADIIQGVSLFDGGGSPSFMDGPHLSQSVARMPFRDLIDGYMKHRSPDTCDSSTASPSVRSRSGSDATFEVPAPVPKRAKRAPTPADGTPPRAAAKPKAPDSPFLPIKLP